MLDEEIFDSIVVDQAHRSIQCCVQVILLTFCCSRRIRINAYMIPNVFSVEKEFYSKCIEKYRTHPKEQRKNPNIICV
ncbi:hypothetical protein Y032_0015g2776 [Ancylostoma ceylanicum]|uniref:Uncharacterized protein n=1 Tax=Ancylostoma ceylanicum TaxID=53326 RepID=A0A016V8B5_9BILA|nr:hypothetical protein Y032_0015g2776 [Ancylostoma ceylanicum]